MDELTTEQVAARLGVSRGHVHKLVEQGRLTARHLNPRLLLFSPASVEAFERTRRPRGRPRNPVPDAPAPEPSRATGRLHTLHYDDAGQVVAGAPDFEGDAD